MAEFVRTESVTLRALRLTAGFCVCLLMTASSEAGDWLRRSPGSNGPGTLFHWISDPHAQGGPDLSAPLVTDRPDFTEAGSTVGKGVAQLEFGYTYTEDDDSGPAVGQHSYPEALLRLGVGADWLELRVATNYSKTTGTPAAVRGAEDLYLGMKIGLTPQAGLLPEMALIPQMTVPTGAAGITADRVLPGVNWIYGWDLTEDLSLAGSTQFNIAADTPRGTYIEWAQSATVGYSLTDSLGTYTEWFAVLPENSGSAVAEHYLNGGLTLLVNNDMQWDIRVGTGLNDAAADYFVGTGLSIRFR